MQENLELRIGTNTNREMLICPLKSEYLRSEHQWRDSKVKKTFYRDFIIILASKIGILVIFFLVY